MVIPTPLVGRPHGSQRFASAIGGGLFLVVALIVLAKGAWIGAPLALFSLFVLSDLWRKATVTETALTARSRIASRSVALSDVVDGGLSPLSRIWLQPREGRAFYLRMVSQYGEGGVADFLPRLAAMVEHAGGSMHPDEKRPHPEGTHPLFSA